MHMVLINILLKTRLSQTCANCIKSGLCTINYSGIGGKIHFQNYPLKCYLNEFLPYYHNNFTHFCNLYTDIHRKMFSRKVGFVTKTQHVVAPERPGFAKVTR